MQNTIFLVAVFVGIIRASLVGELAVVEAYIMLQMLFAFLFSVFYVSQSAGWSIFKGMRSELGQAFPSEFVAMVQAHERYSGLGTFARACLRTAIASYNIWFWFTGINSLSVEPGSSPQIFLFARIQLDSAKIFFRVLALLYFYWAGGSFRHIAAFIRAIRKLRRKQNNTAIALKEHPKGSWKKFNYSWKRLYLFAWEQYLSSSTPNEERREVE